jgi:hypothetical protein
MLSRDAFLNQACDGYFMPCFINTSPTAACFFQKRKQKWRLVINDVMMGAAQTRLSFTVHAHPFLSGHFPSHIAAF